MPRHMLLSVFALACYAAPITAQTSADVSEHCAVEWGSDREMYDYCVGEQSRALRTLQASHEWGSDFEMTLHCVKEQTAAQNRVTTGPSDAIAGYCADEWATDYEMRDHCQKEMRAAKIRVEQYSGPLRGRCEREWGMEYDMVEHCIEEGL